MTFLPTAISSVDFVVTFATILFVVVLQLRATICTFLIPTRCSPHHTTCTTARTTRLPRTTHYHSYTATTHRATPFYVPVLVTLRIFAIYTFTFYVYVRSAFHCRLPRTLHRTTTPIHTTSHGADCSRSGCGARIIPRCSPRTHTTATTHRYLPCGPHTFPLHTHTILFVFDHTPHLLPADDFRLHTAVGFALFITGPVRFVLAVLVFTDLLFVVDTFLVVVVSLRFIR